MRIHQLKLFLGPLMGYVVEEVVHLLMLSKIFFVLC